MLKEGNTSRWIYFTHCAALFLLIAIGVCSAPLFYDYTIVYRGSLNSTILYCIIGGILHLFLWIVLWLFFTIKQNWNFKLRITVSDFIQNRLRNNLFLTHLIILDRKCECETI